MADSNKGFDIPSGYKDNKIVLMVRDPWTIFAYWETSREAEQAVRKTIHENGLVPSKSVLRVYDITKGESRTGRRVVFDFELKNWENSWYVHADRPGRKWMADIGILCATGEFFSLARSNSVHTPDYEISESVSSDASSGGSFSWLESRK